MKTVLLTAVILIVTTFSLISQVNWDPFMNDLAPKTYINCAAIYYHNEILVDEYSPKGKCEIDKNFNGYITLRSIEILEDEIIPMEDLEFQVGFHNKKTNTIRMYSNKVYKEILLDDLLRDLEKDDTIIIMTTDKHYSLPHHEILINNKC